MAQPAARSNGVSHLYYDCIDEICFERKGKALKVNFETEDLSFRSVEQADLPHYQALCTDPEAMRKFNDNEVRLEEKGLEVWREQQMKWVAGRMEVWLRRWKEETDPFSAFSIFKKGTGEFVGFIVAGHGDKPGQTEIAFIFHVSDWNKRYGTQAVTALVQRYLPALIKQGYELDGAPLTEVIAIARLDNPYSIRIMERLKMVKIEDREQWERMRGVFSYTFPKA